MPANISWNPIQTSNAAGTFVVKSDGLVQGTFYDDPAERQKLRGGIVAQTETIGMWGGVGIYELVPTPSTLTSPQPDISLGPIIGRATTLTQTSAGGLTGFTMYNQAINMIIAPGMNNAPTSGTGMTVHYVRLGSGVRIAVAADPALIGLEGGLVSAQVGWDFNNQRLAPYETTATYALSTMVWSATNGGQIAVVTSVPTPVAAVGDAINISGATTTGTGGNSVVNGNFIVNTFTDSQHFTVTATNGNAAFYGTITAGIAVLNYGTGALPCRIDRIVSNSMIVQYNSYTGQITWNSAGTAAVITI